MNLATERAELEREIIDVACVWAGAIADGERPDNLALFSVVGRLLATGYVPAESAEPYFRHAKPGYTLLYKTVVIV